MIPYKLFFEALGLVEKIIFKELGPIDAKVDSGNGAYNVLHGNNLKLSGNSVQFNTVGNKVLQKPIHSTIDINIGAGKIEKRPVVLFDIEFNGKQLAGVPFSISDRSTNEEKVLLGKDFIIKYGGGQINVDSEYLAKT